VYCRCLLPTNEEKLEVDVMRSRRGPSPDVGASRSSKAIASRAQPSASSAVWLPRPAVVAAMLVLHALEQNASLTSALELAEGRQSPNGIHDWSQRPLVAPNNVANSWRRRRRPGSERTCDCDAMNCVSGVPPRGGARESSTGTLGQQPASRGAYGNADQAGSACAPPGARRRS
jgi:hypothetical protein